MGNVLIRMLTGLVVILLLFDIGAVYGALKARDMALKEIDDAITLAEDMKKEEIVLHYPLNQEIRVPLKMNLSVPISMVVKVPINKDIAVRVPLNTYVDVPVNTTARVHIVQNITTTLEVNGQKESVVIPLDTYVNVPIVTRIRVRINDIVNTTVPLNTTVKVPINQTVRVPVDRTLTVPIRMNITIKTTPEEIGLSDLIEKVISTLEHLRSTLEG